VDYVPQSRPNPHDCWPRLRPTNHVAQRPTAGAGPSTSPPVASHLRLIGPWTTSPNHVLILHDHCRGYAPPMIMLGRHRPSPGSWACSIRCTRRSTTIDLGEQLTIGPGPFVEPGSASRCRPFPLALVSTSVDARLRFCRHSSRVTAHERCPKSVGLARNKARVKRQSNVFGQARESGAARLSFAPPPHSLAHRVAQLALEFSPTHRTLVVLPGGRSPPHLHWVPLDPGMVCEVFPPTLAAHHWPRTVRGAGQRFALSPVPTGTLFQSLSSPPPSTLGSVSVAARHASRLTSAVQRLEFT
jgi:hypothetical protein